MILLALAAALSSTVVGMKWDRRVLIVAAPTSDDATLAEQRRIVADWRTEADARDLTVVEVIGDHVTGAGDTAAALRHTYHLPPARFTVVLVGKDGGTKLRAGHPLTAATLAETIDAMPMRRAGGR